MPVQITTTSLPGSQTGTAYSAALAATGGTSPYTWSILSGSLPTGLSLSAGSISGTPTVAGTSNFTVQAQDSKGQTATQALSIVISAAPVPVQITTTSLPGSQTGTAYSAALAATGGTSPYTWSILSGSLPTGLSLSAGSISGTPTVAGTSNFTVQAQDSKGQTATQALSIVISAAPVPVQITTTSLPGSQTGTAYSAALAATGGTSPYTWSILSGSLPTGLSLSAGSISGTPTVAGTSNFTVQAQDSKGQTATQALSIVISAAPVPVQITTTSLPTDQTGTAYSAALAATGGTSPYTWSILSGSLPTGLSLSAGSISGTPTVAGTSNFTVQAQDSKGQTATQALSIVISAAPVPVQITTTSLPGSQTGTAYSAALAATGGTSPYTWSILSGSLPTGLSLSAGSISGTPTVAGTSNFTVQAQDTKGQTASRALSIVISAAPVPVQITTTSLPTDQTGTAYSAPLAATGGTSPYTWSILSGSLPTGLSLSSGTITGTPTVAGTSNFTVQAQDTKGQTASRALSIVISAAPVPVQITTTSLPTDQTGTAYSAPLAATGGTSPYTWSILSGSLPTGLSLSSGTITGTPTVAGTSNFTVQAQDTKGQTASRALSIVISAAPVPVQITTTSLPTDQTGTAYSAPLAATGGTSPYTWSILSGSLPTGLSLSSGTITGTPTVAGTSNFTVQAQDTKGQTASRALSIVISAAPVPVQITTTSLPTDQTGTAYSAPLAATGGTSPYTWSILSGSLPTGLSLSSGTITGTPTVAGTSNFTVQAQDTKGQTASRALSIVISAAPVPVQITTTSLPTDQTGTAYSAPLAATGGTSPYTWSILSGSLPTGLSLSSGTITGTPTVAGTSNFTVQAQDTKGQTASRALSIVISAAPVPVQITTTSLPTDQTGTAYSAPLAATGGTSPYTWSILSGSLPTGLSLSSGTITGTPTVAGTSNFTVQAQDTKGQMASRALSIVISAAPVPVQITTTSLPGGQTGTGYSTTLAATGGTSLYTWSILSGSLPTGLSLSAGTITGMPTVAGTSSFTVEVADSSSTPQTNSKALSINIAGSASGTPLIACQTISSSGTYYLNADVSSTGTCFPITTPNDVTINLNGHTLTYATNPGGNVGRNAISEISCSDPDVSGGYANGAPCAPTSTNFNNTLTVYGPGNITESNNAGQGSHAIRVGTLSSGYTDILVHDVTFNLIQPTSGTAGPGMPIYSDYETGTTYNNTYNNTGTWIVSCLGSGIIARQYFCGANEQFQDQYSTLTSHNNTFAAGSQNGSRATGANSSIHDNTYKINGHWWNDFAIEVEGNNSNVYNNTIRCLKSEGFGCRGIQVYNSTGASVYNNNITVQDEHVWNNTNDGGPGCQIGGAYGLQFNGDSGYPQNASIHNNTVTTYSGLCGGVGLSFSNAGTGVTTHDNSLTCSRLGNSTAYQSGEDYLCTGVRLDTKQYGGSAKIVSTHETISGDTSDVLFYWDGTTSWTCNQCTFVKGNNPAPGWVAFSFKNGGGTADPMYIVDASFAGGASKDSNDLQNTDANHQTASYFIQWTYNVTVDQASNGTPVTSATVTVKDALNNTECSGAPNASGVFSCVVYGRTLVQ